MSFSTFLKNSSSSSDTLEITVAMRREYKELLKNMTGKKMNAISMELITGETIYRVAIDVCKRAIAALKKVIRRGVCTYLPNSKTSELIASFNKVHEEYEAMVNKVAIKMMPTKAENVIQTWLEDTKKAADKFLTHKPQKTIPVVSNPEQRVITEIYV